MEGAELAHSASDQAYDGSERLTLAVSAQILAVMASVVQEPTGY